jgi:hypothetical protein
MPEVPAEIERAITEIVFDREIDPEPCDVIFVFGGSHPGLWETAARAFHKGLGREIIATGGCKPDALRHITWTYGNMPEAEVIARNLERLGVPGERIILETRSTNTYENVCNALALFPFDEVSSVLAVCKSYAVGRQTRTLRAQLAPSVRIIPFSFDTDPAGTGLIIGRHNWTQYRKTRAYIWANLLKIHHYGERGHLEPISCLPQSLEAMIESSLEQLRRSRRSPFA